MPNWCYTNMEVRGKYQDLVRFREAIRVRHKDEARVEWSLNQVFPIPDELADTVSGWTSDEEEQAKREAQYAANREKYGFSDWYDWACANWSSKWGACDVEFDDPDFDEMTDSIRLRYQSAWGPATGLIANISGKFPELVFAVWHQEEGNAFMGSEVFNDGNMMYDCYMEYEEMNLPECDWEDDDSINAFHDAELGILDGLADLAMVEANKIYRTITR